MRTFAKQPEFEFGPAGKEQVGPFVLRSAPFDQMPIQRKTVCACGGECPGCRAKYSNLPVSRPNDASEIEADAVADKVMRIPKGDAPLARTKSENANTAGKINSPQGGNGLDDDTRTFMQDRFGIDFAHVKIHTDAEAVQMNRELNARASTIGNDIYFNRGEYQPHSESGRRLLAHELAHTLQKNDGTVRRVIQVDPGVTLDTMGYTVEKSGDIYSAPRIEQSLLYHEIFTSMLYSPRVFKLKGATSEEANESRRKHMYARIGVVDFASKKGYSFGGAIPTMNPDFWIVDQLNGRPRPKPGVSLEEAMEDLNMNPDEYALGCELATRITVRAGGESEVIGDYSDDLTDWIPGDWGYIKNTKFPKTGGVVGTDGENIIYTGQDKFWGHFNPGLEYKTLLEWYDLVESWNGGAQITARRNYPSAGLE